jgi:hypothetical protein
MRDFFYLYPEYGTRPDILYNAGTQTFKNYKNVLAFLCAWRFEASGQPVTINMTGK